MALADHNAWIGGHFYIPYKRYSGIRCFSRRNSMHCMLFSPKKLEGLQSPKQRSSIQKDAFDLFGVISSFLMPLALNTLKGLKTCFWRQSIQKDILTFLGSFLVSSRKIQWVRMFQSQKLNALHDFVPNQTEMDQTAFKPLLDPKRRNRRPWEPFLGFLTKD